jgi:hypothetical protein
MAETVQIEAARIPDRDRLLTLLVDHGLAAEPDGEVDIRIPCADGQHDSECDDVLAHVESVVMDLGAPFVPIKHDGVIYVRPPLS